MKAIKGSILFASVSILISSCFNPPEFSIEPRISLKELSFGQSTTGGMDSILLAINFQDKDGDLGLDATNIDDFTYPFNQYNYYLASSGTVTMVPTARIYSDLDSDFILPDGNVGKLITVKTLQNPIYTDILPPFSASSCVYDSADVFVEIGNSAIIDPSTVQAVDTLHSDRFPDIINLRDIFYRTINPNYYNITIEILEQTGPEDFVAVKFGNACSQDFNGRFPLLSSDNKSVPLEGVLTYSMKSFGFQSKLNIKPFKIRVQIKDRALHTSNVIETKVITLDKIRK